jgi:hypothetical protein
LAADIAPTDHVDHGRQYGAGFGYRLAHTVRFGFDAIYYARTSQVDATRNYNGLRYGFSISYGLQP